METGIVFLTLLHFFLGIEGQNVQPSQPALVTQTVYGFLDFTTTMGNTVMVFSPKSSTVSIESNPTTPPFKQEVIESKPKHTTKKSLDIKPSKTDFSLEQKNSDVPEKIFTVVNVVSEAPKNGVSEPSPSSVVNVIKPSSVVNVVTASSVISSKVEVVEAATTKLPSSSIITKIEVVSGPAASSSKIDVTPDVFPDIGNNLGEPEYEFLSRQPSEVVEETYKVINLKPSSKFILKPRQSSESKNKVTKKTNSLHPTGLVTRLGGTIVKDGVTTVHETSVIGTYISGKYAQVLQSSSHILGSSPQGKINPSPTLRILKTAAPSLPQKNNKNRILEPTPVGNSINQATEIDLAVQNSIKSTKKTNGPPFKLRYNKNRQNENSDDNNNNENKEVTAQPNYKKKSSRNRSNTRKANTSHRTNKHGRANRKKTTTPSSVHSDDDYTASTSSSSGTTKRYQSRRNKQHRSSSSESPNNNYGNSGGFSKRSFKPKVQPSTVEGGSTSTSLYKFKLNRSPGRWQYKTTPKPRVIIRKQQSNEQSEIKSETSSVFQSNDSAASNEISNQQLTRQQQEEADGLEGSESIASIIDDDSTGENKLDTPSSPLETIKVEISTPPDFKDIYYEIATIKSPYTFQVGSVKNTRFITVTSTFEKSLINTEEPTITPTSSVPLTENILATSSNYEKDNNFLDSSIATLPPIYLASDMETPPLETLTETFSTTETMLKTHILPFIRSPNDTSVSTLVQTYFVTRLVTATKTLPPMEAYHFIPSKTLNEFNSRLDEAGSELHLELEFGDQNDDEISAKRVFPPDLDLANIGSKFDLSDVDKSRITENHLRLKKAHTSSSPKNQIIQEPVTPPNLSPEQLQQLAFLRLLNPAAAAGQPQVITTSKPIIKVETLYESHVIPITNGPHTFSTTLSKIVGTVTKTDYEFGTSTIAPALPQALPFPPAPINPLFPQVPQAQPQFSITSSPVLQTTIVTQTTSKVLKLTFGAKTAYTTVLSSTVVPTILTSYVTASVPVQPTAAAFPGYFPAPFPPFPYVG